MPKTKLQGVVFCTMTVMLMVYCMTAYNIALARGFSNDTFLLALKNMWLEAVAAFIVAQLVVGPVVRKIVCKLFTPGEDKPILIAVAIGALTVAFMAPLMTLFVTIVHGGVSRDLLVRWLYTLTLNFPFALCIQLFYVGPLVRCIFGCGQKALDLRFRN